MAILFFRRSTTSRAVNGIKFQMLMLASAAWTGTGGNCSKSSVTMAFTGLRGDAPFSEFEAEVDESSRDLAL